jgi:HAMP domain-containing protein
MKIRDLILSVLVLGMVISTGTLVLFSSSGIGDIKDTTSEASSGELLANASKNLEYIAIGFRDSLDNQMQNQYQMVRSWAMQPAIINAVKEAQGYSVEELYEMWSAEATRVYNGYVATGDGDPDNDLFPEVSRYLSDLSATTSFKSIFITDYRGYVIAANTATDDFDQGPADWTIRLQSGNPVLMKVGTSEVDEDYWGSISEKIGALEGGETWWKAANVAEDGMYVSDIIWNESTDSWGIETVSQLRDPDTDEYLGLIKAIFDYDTFIAQLVEVENLDVYEIKVVDHNGIVVATSLDDKSKINSILINVKNQAGFQNAIAGGSGSIPNSFTDENGQDVFVGYAMSDDANGHIVMVTKKAADITAPIDAFIGTLQSSIGDRSSTLQNNMIIIGVSVAVVIIILAALIMRAKVTVPLKKLTNVSEKLSKGEIEGLEIDIKGKDEISSFGESFKGVLAAFHFLKDEAEKKN